MQSCVCLCNNSKWCLPFITLYRDSTTLYRDSTTLYHDSIHSIMTRLHSIMTLLDSTTLYLTLIPLAHSTTFSMLLAWHNQPHIHVHVLLPFERKASFAVGDYTHCSVSCPLNFCNSCLHLSISTALIPSAVKGVEEEGGGGRRGRRRRSGRKRKSEGEKEGEGGWRRRGRGRRRRERGRGRTGRN